MVTNYYPSENIENMNIGNKLQSLKTRVASLISGARFLESMHGLWNHMQLDLFNELMDVF